MNNTNIKNTLRSTSTTLHQICNLIPSKLLLAAFMKSGTRDNSRSFTPWSHVLSMVFAQIMGSTSLNDICDSARLHATAFTRCRRAETPKRNTLSHANRTRDASFVEALFWELSGHLCSLAPGFGINRGRKGFPRRFRAAAIHAVDSTTISLVAHCMDWAAHRRRKAACKIHMCLSIADMLPRFVVVAAARAHDNTKARFLCAGLRAGEIVLFDRAYLDFAHLAELASRSVFFVIRAKGNSAVRVVRKLMKPVSEKAAAKTGKPTVLRDDLVSLKGPKSSRDYPETFRRVMVRVEVDGKWKTMVFLTNNLEWSAMSVAELYAARWSIEVFFKRIKGALKLSGFLGHNENAIRWQIWTALITYMLMRYLAFASGWSGRFVRVLTLVRGVIWDKLDTIKLLKAYGTAGGAFEPRLAPETAYLKGFEPAACGTA